MLLHPLFTVNHTPNTSMSFIVQSTWSSLVRVPILPLPYACTHNLYSCLTISVCINMSRGSAYLCRAKIPTISLPYVAPKTQKRLCWFQTFQHPLYEHGCDWCITACDCWGTPPLFSITHSFSDSSILRQPFPPLSFRMKMQFRLPPSPYSSMP